MAFYPYGGMGLPKLEYLDSADNCGTVYGCAKGLILAVIGSILYNGSSGTTSACGIIVGGIGLPYGVASAYYDLKAEYSIECYRNSTAPNEQVSRAKCLALWTSYCVAALIYSQSSQRLAIYDLKILAVKITKISAAIGFGMAATWFNSMDSWNWKVSVGTGFMAGSMVIFLLMFIHQTLPTLSDEARVLLEAGVENRLRERIALMDPQYAQGALELQPLVKRPQLR